MKVDPVRVVLSVSIWFLIMVAGSGYYIWQWMNTPHKVAPEHQSFTIERGASLYAVANELHEKQLIRWPRAWVFYARIKDLASIKAGEYKLSEKESPLSLLSRFQEGDVKQYRITLVEGLAFKKILENLHNHDRIESVLKGKNHEEILKILDLPGDVKHPEGWFFPETYQFTSGDSDVDILRRAHRKMVNVLDFEWKNRDSDLPYKTPYEALIMASIVEKETGAAFERKQIAGVFVRRLKKKMRLQTDPTIIYGLGDSYDGDIKRVHLKQKTPYNTYVIDGLPPTPIASPGQHAINAALNPDSGKTLYFVARGDGTHHFSKTLKEHNRAVNRYQKKPRENYRSSPQAN